MLKFTKESLLKGITKIDSFPELRKGRESIEYDLIFNYKSYPPILVLSEAHKILGITKHHLGKKIIQRTWRGMCYIMLGLEKKKIDTESIRNYQADYLGRFQGNTLLCELMPIPKPRINDWGYEKLIPQFTSRDEYFQVVKPRRIKYLRNLINQYRPKIVIGYGQGKNETYWQAYKELFPNIKFLQSGQFLVARDKNMVVVLTDHFTARTMNGKLDEVVSIIKNSL
jgi:hypothetical protein